MKKILFFVITILVFSCRTEEEAGPANENTFIRYLGTQDNNTAVLAIEVTEGYALLSNIEVEGAEIPHQKIKLTLTDFYGHQVWEKNYASPAPDNHDWIASSFVELTTEESANPGYLIIGESIKENDATTLLLLKTDPSGNLESTTTIAGPAENTSLRGRGITVDDNGDYIVLCSLEGDDVNDMYVAKINAADLSVAWSRVYGAGKSTLINRIYLNDDQKLVWAGSVQNLTSDIRLVRVQENSQLPDIGMDIVKPEFDENAFDLCKTFGGWAITGSTNENGSDEDIFILKVNNQSQEIYSTRLKGDTLQNDIGVSISPTGDGGLVVLGNVGTTDKKEDLSIAKLDASGAKEWQYNYGGADTQEGASIRVTSDGSYLVFGTTYFVNEKKLILMKVNKEGKL